MNMEKAVAFVRSKGNEVEQARLNYVLRDEQPSPEVVARLFAGQQPDGGWSPFWANDYTSLDATCFRLAHAEQLGLTESENAVARALHFLAHRQSPDGSWEEDKKVASLAPPWAMPGDLSAKLYLTANCGLWLALLGNSGNRAAKAAGYLQTHLDRDGHLPGFMHTHWLAGGLWQKLNWQEPAERVFGYLGKRINDLPASNLAWLITTICATGVTTDHHLVAKAASSLAQSQQEDGRWPGEDGQGQDVHTTLEALRALWLCGRARIRIVPIAEAHIEGFRECLDSVARERRYLAFVEAPPLESARDFVRSNIARDIPQFVALNGEDVIGWCDISPMRLEGFTHCGRLGMGVHKRFRRLGIGTRLMEQTISKARGKGLERIELEVFASNTPAIKLYEKLGFVVEGVKKKARKLDGAYDDLVEMALLLRK